MKAEQRKELETNTLADKMGQTMQRVKAGTRRTVLLYLLGVLLLAIALFIAYRWYATSTAEASEQWLKLYDGAPGHLRYLSAKEGETNAGKAARLQVLWINFWELGVKRLGTDQRGSIELFKLLDKEYKDLAEICKDDPLFESQAMLGRAVVVECWAVQDQANLDRAKKLYEELVDKHADSAQAKYAKTRLEHLKDGKKMAETREVYQRLQLLLNVPAADRPQLPPLPDFMDPKKAGDR
jgi:hypothetical protein